MPYNLVYYGYLYRQRGFGTNLSLVLSETHRVRENDITTTQAQDSTIFRRGILRQSLVLLQTPISAAL